MNFAICSLSVVSVRSQSNPQSELLSQLLFGELVEIVDKKGKKWCKVRGLADNHFGWVQTNQLEEIEEKVALEIEKKFGFALDTAQSVRGNNNHFMVPIGARLPLFDGLRFSVFNKNYEYSGQAVLPEELQRNAIDLLPKLARKFLNIPEMKGGRTPFGMDASALVQQIFAFVGIQLPRSADLQIEQGESVDFVEQANEGDLAFFENRKGKITHVGLILADDSIIHTFGKVRIDKLDHFGIFDEQTKKYSHKLRLIKRHLKTTANDKSTLSIKIEEDLNLTEQKILFES